MVICFISWVILNSIALDLCWFQAMPKVSHDKIRASPQKAGTVDVFERTSASRVTDVCHYVHFINSVSWGCVETKGKTRRHHQGWNTVVMFFSSKLTFESAVWNHLLRDARDATLDFLLKCAEACSSFIWDFTLETVLASDPLLSLLYCNPSFCDSTLTFLRFYF